MIKVCLIKTDLMSNSEVSDLAWAHVLQLAEQDLRIPKDSITVKKEAHGKPYFDGYREWQFNISHTSGMIAIAMSDKPVGIDIERTQKQDLRIAERFFTSSEYNYINDPQTDEEKSIRLLRIWTEKEAYMKLTGEGMSRSLQSFDVFDIQANIQTRILEDYILSVCSFDPEDPEIMIEYRTEITGLDERAPA